LPDTRRHFWAVVAREYARGSRPRKVSLNWTMPAFTKNSDGSFWGTSGLDLTTWWPLRAKKSRKR
jgi:hypothetical protein